MSAPLIALQNRNLNSQKTDNSRNGKRFRFIAWYPRIDRRSRRPGSQKTGDCSRDQSGVIAEMVDSVDSLKLVSRLELPRDKGIFAERKNGSLAN
jgi:hypothetical protein